MIPITEKEFYQKNISAVFCRLGIPLFFTPIFYYIESTDEDLGAVDENILKKVVERKETFLSALKIITKEICAGDCGFIRERLGMYLSSSKEIGSGFTLYCFHSFLWGYPKHTLGGE